jgi:hypothetical protein
MYDRRKLAIWGACLLAVAQPHYILRAEPPPDAESPAASGSSATSGTNAEADDAALLGQVKQIASQGQDAQTAAQVIQYVDKNQNVITAILKLYVNYIKQIQSMAADNGGGTPAASGTSVASQGASSDQTADSAAPQDSNAASTVRTSDLQPSTSLRTGHLAGYPALPPVDPVTSITHPTAAQLEYAAKVQKEMQARKAYLMEHPEGYTY